MVTDCPVRSIAGWLKPIEKRQAKAVVRLEPRPLVAGGSPRDFDRALDANEALGDRLFFDAHRLNEEDEGRSRTVEDRHFGGIQVDEGVVDPETGERRHQVFDGAHLGAIALQARAHAGVADEQCRCRQVDHRIEIDAAKDDAGSGAPPGAGSCSP
jgi:hypothetical protein